MPVSWPAVSNSGKRHPVRRPLVDYLATRLHLPAHGRYLVPSALLSFHCRPDMRILALFGFRWGKKNFFFDETGGGKKKLATKDPHVTAKSVASFYLKIFI